MATWLPFAEASKVYGAGVWKLNGFSIRQGEVDKRNLGIDPRRQISNQAFKSTLFVGAYMLHMMNKRANISIRQWDHGILRYLAMRLACRMGTIPTLLQFIHNSIGQLRMQLENPFDYTNHLSHLMEGEWMVLHRSRDTQSITQDVVIITAILLTRDCAFRYLEFKKRGHTFS